MLTPVKAGKNILADNLPADPDALHALNATVGIFDNNRADNVIFFMPAIFRFCKTSVVRTVFVNIILQLTLAALVADRTVQTVVGQQKFEHGGPRLIDLV